MTELDSNSDRHDTKPSAQRKAQLGSQNRINSQGDDFCLVREAWHFCKQLPKKESGKCSEDAVGSFRVSCFGKRALEGREGLVWVGTVAAEELNIQGSERCRNSLKKEFFKAPSKPDCFPLFL